MLSCLSEVDGSADARLLPKNGILISFKNSFRGLFGEFPKVINLFSFFTSAYINVLH